MSGIVNRINGLEETKNIKGVKRIYSDNIVVGKKVEGLVCDVGKTGLVLIVTDTEEECYRTINKIRCTLDIEIETAEGIMHPIW